MGPTGQVDKHMRGDRLSDRPLSGSLSTTTWMGRWPSGQWHQTVNLTGLALRGFESLSAHCSEEANFRLQVRIAGESKLQSRICNWLLDAGVAQLAELQPSKLVVGSSNLLTRFF